MCLYVRNVKDVPVNKRSVMNPNGEGARIVNLIV
jgi:hypothetical protein